MADVLRDVSGPDKSHHSRLSCFILNDELFLN